MKYFFTFLLSALLLGNTQAQQSLWTDVEASRIVLPPGSEVDINASKYRTLALDFQGLTSALRQAPMEYTAAASQPIQIALPLPDGRMEIFDVVESPVMAPGLAARYPDIRSFQAYGTTDRMANARFDYSPLGFHASIRTPQGTVFIEPYASGQRQYHISYYRSDTHVHNPLGLACGFDEEEEVAFEAIQPAIEQQALAFRNNEPVPLRTYRLALACTRAYAAQKGGTLNSVMASFNTAVNLANQIFILEASVRTQLIENNDTLIFLNAATDPYQNINQGRELLGQNPGVLNSYVGADAYDIGHVFTATCSDVGGVASLASVCTSNKGRGVTCHYNNNIATMVSQVYAHEVGHQFNCGHSWNNCPNSLEQLSVENAFEPGSGSTIMSYAGSCGAANNIQNSSDVYYNIGSLEDFIAFSREGTGATCGEVTFPGNRAPEVVLPYQNGFFIPISTPFELTAEGSDIDGDDLTYCWEQYDLGPVSQLGSPSLNAPIFRSAPPTSDPIRVFPSLSKIVNNLSNNNEVLPTYNRDLTFRCTVRDNNPAAGGVTWAEVKFKADQTSGPFLVTAPNTADVSWKVGEYQEVTWDVANTTNMRVRCNYVNIKLSTDGGFTYPITLLANAPNTGSAFVSVPDAVTSTARIRIEPTNNIFFDISDANFRIEPAAEQGFAVSVSPASVPLYCVAGQPLVFDIETASLLGYDNAITLSLIGELPTNTTYLFAQEELLPGQSTTLSIDFGPYATRDTFRLQLQAEGPGLPPALRDIYFIALSNDFSALQLLQPADGTSDITLSTGFSWTAVPNADRYDFQLATKASFGPAVISSTNDILTASHSPNLLLGENQLYFWRVRPVNECGPGEWLPPFAFRTAAVDCADFSANDLPVSIANAAGTIRTSKIFVPTSGIINDLNLRNVEVTFQPVSSIRMTLISPAGTEVRLYNLNCLNTGLIRLGFDDEAPTGILCPPDNSAPVRPNQPLSAFDGENTLGEWQLRTQVVSSGFGGGGSFRSWTLEFCAALTPETPALITNETLEVPPGQSNVITNTLLEATDGASNPDQIVYTILTPPAHGQLFRTSINEELVAGSRFSQSTINTFNLAYVHDGSDTQSDSFTFIVENSQGGWIPTQTFNITIDEDAVVNVQEAPLANGITLFPNPAQDKVQIRFQSAILGQANVRLFNLNGQEVLSRRFADTSAPLELSTAQLPAGLYFVSVQTEAGYYTEKLVVQK
jgi:subtilisin-like proprotein convertase family protein